MNAKIAQFINKGMRQDLSIDKVSNEYAFENVNIRITENEDNTLLSVTNELGNSILDIENPKADEAPWYNEDFPSDVYRDSLAIPGNLIGSCVIAENLVLFFTNVTENYPDAIIRVYKEGDSLTWKLLYCGHLNFSTEHPIETLGDYESESSIKVYWVDGYNQARFINIVADDTKVAAYTDTSFDFLPTINKFADIEISIDYDTVGFFPSGVIQYAFTYSNLNGQESAVFYTSGLHSILFKDRAAAQEEIVQCSFKIGIYNSTIDRSFDRLNIYSIYRSSYNGVPITKRIHSIDISNLSGEWIYYWDTNNTGEIIDNTELYYKGGDYIVSGTLDQKDSVLFLGDLQIERPKVSDTIINQLKNNYRINTNVDHYVPERTDSYFPYTQHEGENYKYLKAFEYYRIGVQLQDKYGKWSSPIYLEDYRHERRPNTEDKEIPNTVLIIDTSEIDTSLYKRIRPVIVYPKDADKSCIAQGVLNPTVYKCKDRCLNKPFAVASWFFRPQNNSYINSNNLDALGFNMYDMLEFRHLRLLSPSDTNSAEIQSQDNIGIISQAQKYKSIGYKTERRFALLGDKNQSLNTQTVRYDSSQKLYYALKNGTVIEENIDNTIDSTILGFKDSSYFGIDSNIVTFNSPELENITANNLSLKLRIVGAALIGNRYGLYYYNSQDGTISSNPAGFIAYEKPGPITHLLSYVGFADGVVPEYSNALDLEGNPLQDERFGYVLYPWQKEGSITNMSSYNTINKKILSNTTYSRRTEFLEEPFEVDTATGYNGITEVQFYDPDKSNLLLLKEYDYNTLLNSNIVKAPSYYGSLNTLATPSYSSYNIYGYGCGINNTEWGTYSEISEFKDFPDYYKALTNMHIYYNPSLDRYARHDQDASGCVEIKLFNTTGQYYPLANNGAFCNDPVSIKYKSTKHAVFSFNTTSDGKMPVLPGSCCTDTTTRSADSLKGDLGYSGYISYGFPFWMKNTGSATLVSPSSFIYSNNTLFEDITDDYLVIGELYRDVNPDTVFGGTSEFAISQNQWIPAGVPMDLGPSSLELSIIGDTKYQRWDCLKTYAYTDEDTNSITETLSFMVESQVNLDGRYDKNRGRTDNTSSSPENVNLFNDVYNQENNYFNYRIFEDFYYTNTKFPNQFTWSLPKSPNSEVDNWTNITLSSVYNVDGSLGKINKIKRFRDVLFGFQDKGIFQILFNSRSQIATTTGVPIELANSGKVDGVRYLSTMEGCQNKWTICETPNGLYFIDDTNHSINRFSGETLQHLSTDKGFDRYMRKGIDVWQHTFYDRNLKDVYFVSQRTSLAFSEKLNEFMSFYPGYAGTPLMCNLYNHFIDIDNSQDNEYYTSYENHVLNNYDIFYGDPYPYSITYRVAQEPYLDKIFTNIEYDAEMRQDGNDLAESFDILKTTTDYQEGSLDLIKPNLIRKFRKWRANIPRDKTHVMDRMRGPWMTLTLTKNANSENRDKQMEFHNLLVKYFV